MSASWKVVWRRFLTLAALAFWQGGFVFYAAVVVPVAMSTLRPPGLQSFVTLNVTRSLNLAGGIALLILAGDILWTSDPDAWRRGFRWACWSVLCLTLAALVWMHPQLAEYMDTENQVILNREGLYPPHRVYLLISTVQWMCATTFLVVSLRAWQGEEGKK